MSGAGLPSSQRGSQAKSQAREQADSQRRAVVTAAQVRPGWLLGALGLLVLAALCFAYLSLCLLFAQGQWQLLYRPSTKITATPAKLGLEFTAVRFGTTEAGIAELSGWWIPAAPGARLAGTTVLYLHDGAGSLSDAVEKLARIHELGCAVFAIDYRGFGASAGTKPSEARMVEDAQRAITYLFETRHIAAGSLVLWGRGIGASIAAEASPAERLPVVLEDMNEPALTLLGRDPRTRLLPVRLLLGDRLDAEGVLQESSAPKLFLGESARTRQLYTVAAGPKQLAPSNWGASEDAGVLAFLAGGGRR